MTDVVILHGIPGFKAGDITPLTDRLVSHVAAGNAKLLPNEHDAWDNDAEPETAEPMRVVTPVSPLLVDGPEAAEADEDTESEDSVGEISPQLAALEPDVPRRAPWARRED